MVVRASFVRIVKIKLRLFMKTSLLLLTSFFLLSCQHQAIEEKIKYDVSEDFVHGSEDIPLLKEMEGVLGSSLGFDTESGSIIHTDYIISGGLEHAREFYIETLPQMGWSLENELIEKIIFQRDSETLEIEFINFNGEDIVKFFLSSAL